MKRLAMIGIRKNGVWETRFGDNVTIRGSNPSNPVFKNDFKIIFKGDNISLEKYNQFRS